MSTVVSDASPLINLARIGRFELLHTFYGELLVPQAVYDEVVVRGRGRDGAEEVRDADWIVVCGPDDDLAVRALAAELGAGEAAAIILAQEREAGLVLMDEIRGRRIAKRLGLRTRGTLGILARAKAEGHVPSLGQAMDLLRARGTWIGDDLYTDVLRQAGEIE
jgi:uncharacterized protein